MRIKERLFELKNEDRFGWKNEEVSEDNKPRLLVYAHYYYPDVASTGQILTELSEGLRERFHVTVICTVPSYTGETTSYYKKHKYYFEVINGVYALRIRVPRFRKNFSISRVINIVSYFLSALVATLKLGKQDYVFTISQPPVLGGLLGVIGSKLKRAKFIYNIQDFNPEQILAVNFTGNKLIIGTMMWLDKWSCKCADKIILVGRDMIETLKKRFPEKELPYVHINNWIDEKSIVPLPSDNEEVVAFKRQYKLENKFVMMYSGNLGLYYDLAGLIKAFVSFKDEKDVVFAFVGGGSLKEELEEFALQNELDNVIFIPYQDKEELVYSLNAADVHFVVNAKGIKGVSVPSKLYGVMAAGKPVLGVLEKGSEARLIIEESSCGRVVEPEDYEGFKALITEFIELNRNNPEKIKEMGSSGRRFLDSRLSRDISINKYKEEIAAL